MRYTTSSDEYWQPGLFEIAELGKAELLGRIAAIAAEMQQRQLDLSETVSGARAAGASWREIGEANGTTAQAAQQRYSQASRG